MLSIMMILILLLIAAAAVVVNGEDKNIFVCSFQSCHDFRFFKVPVA